MKKRPRPVGRPANPYTSDNRDWQPLGTQFWFDNETDLEPRPNVPGADPRIEIRWYAYGLIMLLEVPVLRRVIESILVFDHGFKPDAVTAALKGLMKREYLGGKHITMTRLKYASEVNHVYCYGRRPTKAELGFLKAAYRLRHSVLGINVLKNAGERYVRTLMMRSGRYAHITQAKKLGRVTDVNGRNSLDIRVTARRSRISFGLSVKNQNAWIYPNDRAIKDVYKRAKAQGVKPWLVVPFATDAAIMRCLHDGIRLTVLGRQIVPAEDKWGRPMRVVIKGIRSVLGPQPFEYLYARGSRTFEESGAARQDVEKMDGGIYPALNAG